MINLHEKQKNRQSHDKKLYLIAELQKLGITETADGRTLEECTLFTLEHTHINEMCRVGRLA